MHRFIRTGLYILISLFITGLFVTSSIPYTVVYYAHGYNDDSWYSFALHQNSIIFNHDNVQYFEKYSENRITSYINPTVTRQDAEYALDKCDEYYTSNDIEPLVSHFKSTMNHTILMSNALEENRYEDAKYQYKQAIKHHTEFCGWKYYSVYNREYISMDTILNIIMSNISQIVPWVEYEAN